MDKRVNHICDGMRRDNFAKINESVKMFYDSNLKRNIFYCHYCGEIIKVGRRRTGWVTTYENTFSINPQTRKKITLSMICAELDKLAEMAKETYPSHLYRYSMSYRVETRTLWKVTYHVFVDIYERGDFSRD